VGGEGCYNGFLFRKLKHRNGVNYVSRGTSGGILEGLRKRRERKKAGEINGKPTYLTSDGREVYGNNRPITGAISGAHDPDSDEADKHAKQYYPAVRKMTGDIDRISKNTGYMPKDIKRIKEHLFMAKHDLGGKEPEHFAPDYAIGQSWQRLIDGKDIQSHDIVLLEHELMESELMRSGVTQNEAHDKTNEVHNYTEALSKFLRKEN
jgi:hypothetical protein